MKRITVLLALFLLSSGMVLANEKILIKEGLTKRYRYNKPIKFVERGVVFYVYPNGDLDFNDRNHYRRGRVSVGYNAPGGRFYYRSNPYRSRIIYDYHGRVKRIKNIYIGYDRLGRVKRIGDIYINYNRRGWVSHVGGLYVYYNRFGEIRGYEGYVNGDNEYRYKKHPRKFRYNDHEYTDKKRRTYRAHDDDDDDDYDDD